MNSFHVLHFKLRSIVAAKLNGAVAHSFEAPDQADPPEWARTSSPAVGHREGSSQAFTPTWKTGSITFVSMMIAYLPSGIRLRPSLIGSNLNLPALRSEILP